jgi:serine/threonine protein phosphatase PrpC
MNSDGARLEVGALSETGYVRDENQDRMSRIPVPLGELYIVADGMGGHNGGALAAEIAVEELQRHISQAPPSEPVDQVIQEAFKKANQTVYAKARSGDPATEGMGTTAVLLLVSSQVAKLAHVGDSRAYLYRDGRLSQLTTDHTVVQRMVQAGMLKPEQAAGHPDASVLERAIGSKPDIEVDIRNEQLKDGDAILLCSDGLSGYVTDGQIESVLRSRGTVQETTENLVKLALEHGGNDNVTVQLIQYGTRRETQAVRQTQPVKPTPKPAPAPRRFTAQREGPPRRTLAAFAIAGIVAVSAVALFFFWNAKNTGELQTAREGTKSLEKKLQAANAAKDDAIKQMEILREELRAAGQSGKTTTDNLKKELRTANADKEKALRDGEELKKQLATAKQSATASAEKMQKQLQAADAAKEKALTEVRDLRQKLDSKERDLQEVKKQLESLTNANKASPAQQETTPTKVPTGTPATTGAR